MKKFLWNRCVFSSRTIGMCLLISRGSFDGEDKGPCWIIKILVLTRPSDNVCNFFMVNVFINYFLRAARLWLAGMAGRWWWVGIYDITFPLHPIKKHFYAWHPTRPGQSECLCKLVVSIARPASLYTTMGIKQIEYFTRKADRGKTPLTAHRSSLRYHC